MRIYSGINAEENKTKQNEKIYIFQTKQQILNSI